MQKESLSKPIARRKFLKWIGGGLLGIGACAAGLYYLSETKAYSLTERRALMGTFVDITGYGAEEEKVQRAIDQAFAEITHVDDSMSVFKKSSSVYRINASPHKKEIPLDSELAYLLNRAHEFSKVTGGSFDITVAPLMNLWGFYNKDLNVPAKEELEETLQKVDYRAFHVNQSENILQFDRSEMMLDLGGIAKGYAVDRAVNKLKKYELSAGLVNAGGDIRVFGTPDHRDNWRIGLENPLKKKDILCSIKLITKAITTSGNYESFFTYQGEKLAHIINPKTGLPVKDVLSVSILANTALKADALSTGAFSQGPQEAIELAEELDHTEIIYIWREKGRVRVAVSRGLSANIDTEKLERNLN